MHPKYDKAFTIKAMEGYEAVAAQQDDVPGTERFVTHAPDYRSQLVSAIIYGHKVVQEIPPLRSGEETKL